MYFLKKFKNRMIVTAVAIILIIMVGVTNRDRPNMTKFEKIIGNIVSPITKVTYSIGNRVTGFFSNISSISSLKEDNEELKIRVAALEDENRDLHNLVGQYDFLKNEFELLNSTDYRLISAQITGKSPENWYDTFTIDKGLNDGIEKNDNVIKGIETENGVIEEGIVGRVTDVGDNWAKVISIVDEQSRIAFKIIRTQDGGVLSGSADGEIMGYLFDSEAQVISGDEVYTSGLGEVFHRDLYIGEVEEVEEVEEELMKKITVKPSIDFKKLHKVFVIKD